MSIQKEIYDAYKMQKDSFNFLHKLMTKEGIILDDIAVTITDKTIKPIKIIQLVEEVFNTNIKANNRKQSTIFGRQAAAYLLRLYTRLSLSEIAPYCGISHHTTTLYSIKRCRDLMDTEDWYKEKVMQICTELDEYNLYLSSN
jgi:chromosomal replication initiation ATPase DnaA